MGKEPVRLREVCYTLSPMHQNMMSGIWKGMPHVIKHKVQASWLNAIFFLGPAAGTYWYVQWFKEKEKQHHRY